MWRAAIDTIDGILGPRKRRGRTREAGHNGHVFSVHPFKGDIVMLVGECRELCSVEEVDKVDTS